MQSPLFVSSGRILQEDPRLDAPCVSLASKGHHQVSTLNIGSPSQPMHNFCVVPMVSDGETDVMLQITIDLALDYYNMYELEEEDDSDKDYDEDDDEEDDTDEEVGDKDGEADDHNGV